MKFQNKDFVLVFNILWKFIHTLFSIFPHMHVWSLLRIRVSCSWKQTAKYDLESHKYIIESSEPDAIADHCSEHHD